jgi:hypothetical protein
MTQFKPGDRVTHDPTGEEWTVARAYGSYVDSVGCTRRVLAIDCTLICACTRACDAVVL